MSRERRHSNSCLPKGSGSYANWMATGRGSASGISLTASQRSCRQPAAQQLRFTVRQLAESTTRLSLPTDIRRHGHKSDRCDLNATFHLLNFPVFFGLADYIVKTGEPPYQGSSRHGRVVLEADGWSITIAETDATQVLAKGLSAQGGYVLTHVGQIKRADGSTFTSDGLEDVLTCLHYFLSFALGRWAGVCAARRIRSKGV